jgi:hypothetical protein
LLALSGQAGVSNPRRLGRRPAESRTAAVARPESEGGLDERYYAFLISVLEKSSPLNSSGNPERFAKA